MAKLVTVKVLLALASSHNWHLVQMDVNNTFLNGDLFEEVYMDLPLVYDRKGEYFASDFGGKMVCQLHKSISGLEQASRQWYSKFLQAMINFGFIQSKFDYSLFTKSSCSSFLALLVYVDDIVITRPSLETIAYLKTFLYS